VDYSSPAGSSSGILRRRSSPFLLCLIFTVFFWQVSEHLSSSLPSSSLSRGSQGKPRPYDLHVWIHHGRKRGGVHGVKGLRSDSASRPTCQHLLADVAPPMLLSSGLPSNLAEGDVEEVDFAGPRGAPHFQGFLSCSKPSI
jgi:hypothetical protein